MVMKEPSSCFFWYSLLCMRPEIATLSPTARFLTKRAFLPHAMAGI